MIHQPESRKNHHIVVLFIIRLRFVEENINDLERTSVLIIFFFTDSEHTEYCRCIY